MGTAKPCCVLIIELNLETSWKSQFSAAVALSCHRTRQGRSGCGSHGNALGMGRLTVPFPALLFSQQPFPAVIPHHIAPFSRFSRHTGLLPTRLGCPPPQHHTHTALSCRGRLPSSFSASTNVQLSVSLQFQPLQR